MEDKKERDLKINITSGAIEKSIEMASGFLSNLITPSIEEFGLLMKDAITGWRFKNQVKILNKAKDYCKKHNISPKAISLKALVPLLENATLEEDDFLQDKWSILLGNMADADQNIENAVVPFILSQLSKTEFINLEKEYYRISMELDELHPQLAGVEAMYRDKYIPLGQEEEIKNRAKRLQEKIHLVQFISYRDFQPFEIANLIRCGLIRIIPVQYGYSKELQYGSGIFNRLVTTRNLEVEIDYVADSYVLTELGKLFFKVCNEKKVSDK